MGEVREIRGTGRSLGQASQGVDLVGPSILVFLEVDGVIRIGWRGPDQRSCRVAGRSPHPSHCHRVWNVPCMWMQESGCHPGHQVLVQEERGSQSLVLLSDTSASHRDSLWEPTIT